MLFKAELYCYTLSKIYQFHIFLNLAKTGMFSLFSRFNSTCPASL